MKPENWQAIAKAHVVQLEGGDQDVLDKVQDGLGLNDSDFVRFLALFQKLAPPGVGSRLVQIRLPKR